MDGLPKLLVIVGLAIAGLGVLLWLAQYLPEDLRPFHLPGDIHIKRDGGSFHLPITTMVLLSLLGTGVLSLARLWKG